MADLFQSVLSASLWGSLLSVVFLIIQRLFKNKLPLSWQYYIWFVVLLRLLIPLNVGISLPLDTAAARAETAGWRSGAGLINNTEPNADEDMEVGAGLTKSAGEVKTKSAEASSGFESIIRLLNFLSDRNAQDLAYVFLRKMAESFYLWIVWLIPAVILFIFKIVSYSRFVKKLREEEVETEASERQIFEKQIVQSGFRADVKLYKSSMAQMPFVIGLFKQAVILPNKKFSEMQLIYIFRHELKHIANRDIIHKWLFEAAKCLHWFNPFVYIAASRASFCAEARCDASVLKGSSETDRKEYSMTIVEVLRLSVSTKFSVHMPMGGNRADLKERIQTILRGYEKKNSLFVMVFISIFVIGLYLVSSLTYKEVPDDFSDSLPSAQVPALSDGSNFAEREDLIPASTNVLLTSMDAFGNADVIMLAEFDSVANELEVTSLPRDMYLQSADTKLRKFISLANDDIDYFQNELSSVLGVDIDYCVQLDMEGFEKVVDAAGGLEMEIPEGGLYYSDPYQNLEIALEGGRQHLNGEKALQYVRYRRDNRGNGYELGDLQRISVQQQLLSELYKKLMSGEKLFEKLYAVTSVLLENTKTNMTPETAAAYLEYAIKLDKDSLKINTVAWETQIADDGQLYYIPRV